MNKTILIAGCLTAALAGCSSMPLGGKSGGDSSKNVAGQAADTGVVLTAIPESNVPKGECGMILWTLDETRPSPVFRYVSGKKAEIAIGGESVTLSLLETGGAAGFGVFEEQTFASDTGLRVSVNARFSLGFDGGSYLERGLITVESQDGWRTVVPSAGLAGCRSK